MSVLEYDGAATAKVADRTVTDMADNANKMGTSMESIQKLLMYTAITLGFTWSITYLIAAF